jgi:PAS domain S-box-containing protein
MTDHYETSQHLKTLSKLYLVVAFALLIMLLAWIYIYLFSVNEAFDIVMWIGLISALFSIGLLLTVILTERRILRRVEGVARELVRQSNELEGFRFAVDNTFDQILITDPAGVVIYANNATTKITGYSKREILGHRPGDLWGGHMPHRFYEKMWSRIKKDKKFFVGTIVNRKKGGKEYTAEMSITPILGKRSQILYYILVARDVTREIAADKLKAEFITLVSHQLKTPVASMKWMLEMLIHNELGILD